MAETPTDHVTSDLPDLTGVALADLPAICLPQQDIVVERVADHPADDHKDQNLMPV